MAGQCVENPEEKVKDLGCATWDWNRQVCLKCSNNWVFQNGVCVPVSDQCNTFDVSGNCVSCYKGYRLVAGRCERMPEEKVEDLGCATWDWDNKRCLQCSRRWVFNAARKCVPVSDNCNEWNDSGVCTSCFRGYRLDNGVCTQANSLCETSNASGACTTCYSGYILDNGSCVPISKLANLALYYSQCCPERLAELTANVGNGQTFP